MVIFMLGEVELKKLFPDFEDLVQPSGIDLELDKIYINGGYRGFCLEMNPEVITRLLNAIPVKVAI